MMRKYSPTASGDVGSGGMGANLLVVAKDFRDRKTQNNVLTGNNRRKR